MRSDADDQRCSTATVAATRRRREGRREDVSDDLGASLRARRRRIGKRAAQLRRLAQGARRREQLAGGAEVNAGVPARAADVAAVA